MKYVCNIEEDDQPCFLPLSKYDYYLFILTREKIIIKGFLNQNYSSKLERKT